MGFVKDNSGLLIPEELATIKKDTLNSTLAGIVGNQFITLTTRKYDNTYNTNYIIHRCINILAENGAKLPMRLYHNGKLMDEGFIIPQHGGFNLQKPHPKMSMNQLLYEGLVYKYYRGELMFYIDLEGRLTLEPINPKLMKIKTKDRMGNIEIWRWNRKLDIKTEELIYDKIFNPSIVKKNLVLSYIAYFKYHYRSTMITVHELKIMGTDDQKSDGWFDGAVKSAEDFIDQLKWVKIQHEIEPAEYMRFSQRNCGFVGRAISPRMK